MSDTTMSITLHDLDKETAAAVMAVVYGDAPAAKPAAAKKTTTSSKAKADPKPKPKDDKPVESDEGGTPEASLDDVRNALKAYRTEHSKEDAELIIKATGAKSISAIPEDKFGLVMELCEKEPGDLPGAASGDDDWD